MSSLLWMDILGALALKYTDHPRTKWACGEVWGGTGAHTCGPTHLRGRDPGMWKKGGCCGTHRSGRHHYGICGKQQE